MKLNFEIVKEVGTGSFPDNLHLATNQINMIYVRNGKMRNQIGEFVDGWGNVNFVDDVQVSQDANITHLRMETLGRFGAIGSYKSNDSHKLIISEYEFDI